MWVERSQFLFDRHGRFGEGPVVAGTRDGEEARTLLNDS